MRSDARHPVGAAGGLLGALAATLALGLTAPGPAGAQEGPPPGPGKGTVALEVRGGVVLSTPFLEGDVPSLRGVGVVKVAPDPAPHLGASLLWAVEPPVSLEAAVGVSRAAVGGSGRVADWDAGSVTVAHGTAGFRYHPLPWAHLGAGVGLVVISVGDEVPWLGEEGAHLLISGGVGVTPWRELPLTVEVTAQGHSLGGTALRAAGGRDGDVGRLVIGIAWSPWEAP